MNAISAWAIRHPVPTIVMFLILSLSGALSFAQLRINDMPDIDIPIVTVSLARAGAAPTEMETQVTRPIEDSVFGLGRVEHIRSTINEGVSTTSIEFSLGTDIERALEDVRNAVGSVQSNLPADVSAPVIQRVDATGQSVITFAVGSSQMAPDDLSWFIDSEVADAVLSVDGVSKIERVGGVEAEIRVELNPDRLLALGITASEISEQLKAQNADLPSGRTELGLREQTVRTLGAAEDIRTLSQTRIVLRGGRTVMLSDLGSVELSWAEPRQSARLDGKDIVGFGVFRSAGTGEVAVTEAVRERMARFSVEHPEVTIQEVTTSTDDVLEGYAAAIEALVIGAAFAVVVVWMFLRDLRATLVASVALPLSLLPTFGAMYLLDQSLNSITLLGIALVVGVLVDDAIVEIENITRHIRQSGSSAYDAALRAADEIGLAVVATTFSILAVFVPVGLMGGIAGQFFNAFAIAICTSVFFSLVVARMLTPLMGAYFMTSHGARSDQPFWLPAYLRALGWTLKWRWLTIVAGIVLFAGSMSFTLLMPADFMPQTDRARSMLSIELEPGAGLAATDRVVHKAIAILKARPEVTSVYAALGTPVSLGGIGDDNVSGDVRKATLTVNLKPRSARTLSQQEFEAATTRELSDLPGARLRFGAGGQMAGKVQVALRSDDKTLLLRAVVSVSQELSARSGFRNVGSTVSLARPEIQISPKADRAAALGISTETIARTVRIATLGEASHNLSKFSLADRRLPVRVLLDETAMSNLARLTSLQIPTASGVVPLASVADISLGASSNQIDRVDRRLSATVEAELEGLTLSEAETLIADLPAIRNLPPAVSRHASGDGENMQELVDGFVIVLISAVVLLYFVITLLFNNFIQSITILTALPLSIGGAFGLMIVSGTPLSMPALIGLLMLMGVAAKNSILLVEFAASAQNRSGLSRNDALLEAARKRARPIVMTTAAMGAGMAPIALGIGADAEFRAPMAIAVIGGLLSSTALSLIYVPAAYTLMDDLDRWVRRRCSRRWNIKAIAT